MIKNSSLCDYKLKYKTYMCLHVPIWAKPYLQLPICLVTYGPTRAMNTYIFLTTTYSQLYREGTYDPMIPSYISLSGLYRYQHFSWCCQDLQGLVVLGMVILCWRLENVSKAAVFIWCTTSIGVLLLQSQYLCSSRSKTFLRIVSVTFSMKIILVIECFNFYIGTSQYDPPKISYDKAVGEQEGAIQLWYYQPVRSCLCWYVFFHQLLTSLASSSLSLSYFHFTSSGIWKLTIGWPHDFFKFHMLWQ
jgi:hypothetical protein